MADLIDRHVVIEEISKYHITSGITGQATWNDCVDIIIETLESLPSAQLEREKGRWIWWYEEAFTEHATEYTPHCKCSECGRECAPIVATSSNFCPNCGADMRKDGEQA